MITMPKEYEYIIPLDKKPEIVKVTGTASLSRKIAKEFVESGLEAAEIPLGKFKSITALSRSLGRALHNKKHGLDKENKIVVQSDKENNKVYLIKE